MPVRRRQQGFTLIELVVVLTIVGVLTRLALPSFQSAILSNRLASYANSFVAAVQLARSEAIKRNSSVTLCRSTDGTSCAASGTWQQGWIVMAGSTVLVYQQALSDSYSFTTTSSGTPYSLSFPASGVGATSATVKICRVSPSAGDQERTIDVSPTGRTTVTKTTTGTCP